MFERYSVESSDVAFVIGRYNEVIDTTKELTDEEKVNIKASFATALYSSKYWDEKLK